MTVIVYANGVMAADTRAYSGESTPIGHKQKIHRLSDGSLFGASTTKPGLAEAFARWLETGMAGEPPKDIDMKGLWVRPSGEVFLFMNSHEPSGPLVGPFFAVGSGEQYALGALSLGADAVKAVEVACLHDPWCAAPVMRLSLDPSLDMPAAPESEAIAENGSEDVAASADDGVAE